MNTITSASDLISEFYEGLADVTDEDWRKGMGTVIPNKRLVVMKRIVGTLEKRMSST